MSETLVEVIKETKIGQEPWFELKMNNVIVYGSYSLDKVMTVYKDIKKNNPPVLTREILISEKI